MAVIYRGVERGWTGSDRGGAGVVDLGCKLGWVGSGGQRVWEKETVCVDRVEQLWVENTI